MGKGLLVSILAGGVVVSIFLKVVLYYQNYTINQQKNDFTAYYNEFGNVSLQSISYNFSPPVSMYRALKIALENGGWNTTSLENMTVKVSLGYYEFWNDSTLVKSPYDNTTLGPGQGTQLLNQVTHSVNDYSAVTVKNATYTTTYRYIWTITVEPSSGGFFIPPPGLYFVDAATAKIVPTGPLY